MSAETQRLRAAQTEAFFEQTQPEPDAAEAEPVPPVVNMREAVEAVDWRLVDPNPVPESNVLRVGPWWTETGYESDPIVDPVAIEQALVDTVPADEPQDTTTASDDAAGD